MSRNTMLVVVAAVLVSVLAIAVGWRLGQRRSRPTDAPEVVPPPMEEIGESVTTVELYFPGPGGRLHGEQREMSVEPELEPRLGSLLGELLSGPQSPELYAALPAEITLGWFHLNPQRVAYIDLEVGAEVSVPAWGSRREMLSVYSLVNTILANIPEIRAVVLLRNGQQHTTFAGHLDTSRPLVANRDLVASR